MTKRIGSSGISPRVLCVYVYVSDLNTEIPVVFTFRKLLRCPQIRDSLTIPVVFTTFRKFLRCPQIRDSLTIASLVAQMTMAYMVVGVSANCS